MIEVLRKNSKFVLMDRENKLLGQKQEPSTKVCYQYT